MATAMNDYHCDVYEHECFAPGPAMKASFFIDFFFTDDRDSPIIYQNLTVQQNLILRDTNSWSTISRELSEMNIPLYTHAGFIHKITDYARSVVNQEHNMNRNLIHLVVNIKAVSNYEETAISEAAWQSINEQVLNLVPASWSSIEALQKTTVEGSSKPCVICLDEILVGSEATRMPCSHFYHQDCIVSWLAKSNLCPLCRFNMPS